MTSDSDIATITWASYLEVDAHKQLRATGWVWGYDKGQSLKLQLIDYAEQPH